jgi:hypothetical protein
MKDEKDLAHPSSFTLSFGEVPVMEQAAPCCFCWLASAAWTLGQDDRFCSLCGQRITTVTPRGPVLRHGPGAPLLAVYLEEDGPGELAGCLEFHLRGRAEQLTPRWRSSGEPASRVSSWERPSPDTLLLQVRTKPLPAIANGAIGKASLAIELPADCFVFEVHLYALPEQRPRAWLSRRDGTGSVDAVWVLYRDTHDGVLLVRCDLGGVPVQIERVDCPHEAVTPRLLTDSASPQSQAVAHWDVSRLRRDVEEDVVPFRVYLRGLPPVALQQRILWRMRQPLSCYPAALTVPLLTSGANYDYLVQLQNVDSVDLRIVRVESSVPWIEPLLGPAQVLSLRAGESSHLLLRLRAGVIDAGGPHLATVTFHFRGLGKQAYDVRVERVRTPRWLTGPLLVDPGPPRIVIGYPDPDTGELTYLPGAGTIGLSPEALGLPLWDYLGAVYRGRRAEALVGRLVEAARSGAANRGAVIAGEVRLVGRPWVPTTLSLPDVQRIDALELCRRPPHPLSPSPSLGEGENAAVEVLLEAWCTWVLPPGAPGQMSSPPRRSQGLTNTLGIRLVHCLLRHLREGARLSQADEAQLGLVERPAPAIPDRALWLQQAGEAFLADHAWGPAHAWDALLAVVAEHLPSARGCSLERTLLIADFQRELNEYLQLLTKAVGQRTCVLVCPLFSEEVIDRIVQSGETPPGSPVAFRAPEWLEWAVR